MKIRAAVLEEFGKPLAVREVDLAEPKAGEALVRNIPSAVVRQQDSERGPRRRAAEEADHRAGARRRLPSARSRPSAPARGTRLPSASADFAPFFFWLAENGDGDEAYARAHEPIDARQRAAQRGGDRERGGAEVAERDGETDGSGREAGEEEGP